ncbi:hypothetical protein [Nostoc sp.]|uniref:hypothetical protein n=1 Tax=Nostoc sp. TaxID=1180 RepID=UPI002FF98E66
MSYVGRLGSRDNRECVYQFVPVDDQRDSIFGQWLNRDESSSSGCSFKWAIPLKQQEELFQLELI